MMGLGLVLKTGNSGLVAFVFLAFGDVSCRSWCWQHLQMLLAIGN